MGLVARTRLLDPDRPTDRLAVDAFGGIGTGTAAGPHFEHPGQLLAGSPHLALRLPATAAAWAEAVAGIDIDDTVGLPGCGPVAFAALPFDRTAPGELLVPSTVVGRGPDGHWWKTVIGDAAVLDAASRMSGLQAKADGFSAKLAIGHHGEAGGHGVAGVTVAPVRSPAAWCASVAAARDELRAGRARKVVLARELAVTADPTAAGPVLDPGVLLDRLRTSYAGCYLYAMPLPGGAHLVGASPELLVARRGDGVRSHPMAGTAPRSGDPETDLALATELLTSLKDQVEHRITIDMVHETLLPWCSYLDEEAEPSIVAVANVQHLATMVEGRLSDPPASVLELMAALHPTPAVCGDPRDEALALIAAHEGMERGAYAGPVGWVDHAGNGEWAVGIRCAEVAADGRSARLFAGVGVVADSDPEAELAETEAKFRAMRSAIGA